MKIYLILTAAMSLLMVLFPLAAVGFASDAKESTTVVCESTAETNENETAQTETTVQKAEEETVKVLRVSSGKVMELQMYDYVVGAVASEISPTYEKEAIKAQAVACYTYAKWLMQNADNASLSGADISDSTQSHQGYYDSDELKEKWNDKYDTYITKIKECVSEVFGQYMTYENEVILACYHAVSPGQTESAKNVWGKDISYLKSVSAPGDKLSPDIDSEATFSKEEFLKKAETLDGVFLESDESKWLGKTKTTDTGFVSSLEIGGKTFDGNEIRTAFSLKSPYFTVKYEGGKFTFSVKGYGHGLGMSQYSADYMARQGSSYEEILLHFYSGVKIEK